MKRLRDENGLTMTKAKRTVKQRVSGPQISRINYSRQLNPAATRGYPGTYGGYGQRKRSNVELKVLDTFSNLAFDNGNGNVVLLNGIAQGTDFNQRIGRKFTIKSIYIRAEAFQGTAAPVTANCRILIVYDSQTNSANVTVSNVLNVGASNPTTAMNELTNRDRFKILLDWTDTISPQGPQGLFMKKYLRCDLETINSGTANTFGSIQTGGLWMLVIGDNAAGTANPVGASQVRIRYVDD